ncbi:MAG: hypothetical protein ACFFCW_24695 [Candidatus Hodarchaeota archaeon]
MNIFLQIFGSIASIGGIPLAIYLYLRSREAKYSKLRQEVVKILSFQIGEGRNLSTFEIQAVIDSKIRGARVKLDSIVVNDVVEDLVSETISSPMLESDRKKEILDNLRKIHQRGNILYALDRYDISLRSFLYGIRNYVKLTTEDSELIKERIGEFEAEELVKKPVKAEAVSTIFGIVGVIVAALAFLISFFGESKIMESFSTFFENNEQLLRITLGIIAGIVASILTALISKTKKDFGRKFRGKDKKIKEENG